MGGFDIAWYLWERFQFWGGSYYMEHAANEGELAGGYGGHTPACHYD